MSKEKNVLKEFSNASSYTHQFQLNLWIAKYGVPQSQILNFNHNFL